MAAIAPCDYISTQGDVVTQLFAWSVSTKGNRCDWSCFVWASFFPSRLSLSLTQIPVVLDVEEQCDPAGEPQSIHY